jgi:hypothetical protein
LKETTALQLEKEICEGTYCGSILAFDYFQLSYILLYLIDEIHNLAPTLKAIGHQ